MASVNLNLPNDLHQFVTGQVESGPFDGADSYITALISRAKKGSEQLESLLIEGLESGDPIPLDAKEWKSIRQEVTDRLTHGD